MSPRGERLLLPRRELFDIRLQIMSEEDVLLSDDPSGLGNADIKTNVYEGGFKTWECSYDLARLLLDRGPRRDLDHVIEVLLLRPFQCLLTWLKLGCGTSIPSLVLFHHAITESLPMCFTFADYNLSVLQKATLPNLLLAFASTLKEAPFENPLSDTSPGSSGDLEITPALTSMFLDTVRRIGLHLTFVSGSWVPSRPFLESIPSCPDLNTLVLASETIYSPKALSDFAAVLVGILRVVPLGKAVVAAKRVYFGVGGSVDAFKVECTKHGAVAAEIEKHGIDLGDTTGVRRCLLEVQMA